MIHKFRCQSMEPRYSPRCVFNVPPIFQAHFHLLAGCKKENNLSGKKKKDREMMIYRKDVNLPEPRKDKSTIIVFF